MNTIDIINGAVIINGHTFEFPISYDELKGALGEARIEYSGKKNDYVSYIYDDLGLRFDGSLFYLKDLINKMAYKDDDHDIVGMAVYVTGNRIYDGSKPEKTYVGNVTVLGEQIVGENTWRAGTGFGYAPLIKDEGKEKVWINVQATIIKDYGNAQHYEGKLYEGDRILEDISIYFHPVKPKTKKAPAKKTSKTTEASNASKVKTAGKTVQGADKEREELLESIKAKVGKKNVQSLCNKIIKHCSFKSETDLGNISDLAMWLYIYECYDEMFAVCDLVKDLEFVNYALWNGPDTCMCLKARVYRERGELEKARELVEKINEHRAPELYCNIADSFDRMDEDREAFIEEFPKKKTVIAWKYFYKLSFDIVYREPGKFPIPDEKFEEDIKRQLVILRETA